MGRPGHCGVGSVLAGGVGLGGVGGGTGVGGLGGGADAVCEAAGVSGMGMSRVTCVDVDGGGLLEDEVKGGGVER